MSHSRVQQAANLNALRGLNLELAIYSSNPGPSDSGTEMTSSGGYARQTIAFGVPQTESDGTYILNSALVSFPTASGDWSAVASHYGIREVGGSLRNYGPLQELGVDTTRSVRTGDTFRVAPNTLKVKEFD
jgi:hypothetical protein